MIVVWQKFHDAENAVSQEAAAVVAVYWLSGRIGGDATIELRDRLTAYVNSVLDDDWAAMARGHTSHDTTRALNDVYAAALKTEPAGSRGSVVMAEIFHQLGQITQARRERIVVAAGAVPGIIWSVLVVGGVITVGSAFFFGSENARPAAHDDHAFRRRVHGAARHRLDQLPVHRPGQRFAGAFQPRSSGFRKGVRVGGAREEEGWNR
ncbi:MAG: hypothetical protein WAN51_12205 [Alphaproteobacteria bacterium]